jgi:hypothetical protein
MRFHKCSYSNLLRGKIMSSAFKVGDHVKWNSDVGHITGKVTKVHHQDFQFLGRSRKASADEPQYEVCSDKTGRSAAHKGSALNKV